MKFFILFLIATAINVILSTMRSLITIKGTKLSAAAINAVCYGFYSYIIILTNGDGLSTVAKMLITAGCNFVCVYLVKWIDEKRTPEKMWKIEIAIPVEKTDAIIAHKTFEANGIPNNFNNLGSWVIFNCYCDTCKKTDLVANFCKANNGKMSAYESKI